MDHPISNKSNLNTSTSSSSSTWTLPTATAAAALSSSPPSDEISLFLQQILLRSSSSPTNNIRPFLTHTIIPHEISAVDSSSSHVLHDLTPTAPNNASSTSFDCHSDQEALLVQDLLPTTDPNNNNNPPPPPRTSSKRCRASQFHNLSEKRRRGRINHKMKALQNLIPNSNKTDKAWMLDEAIEYLKHLQLQVQILSMRNGKTPFQLLPSVHPHITPFYFTPSSKEICTDVIQDHQVNLSQSQTTTPFVSRPYNIPVPDLQELQNCVTTLEHSHVFPSLFNGIDTGRSTETTEPQR